MSNIINRCSRNCNLRKCLKTSVGFFYRSCSNVSEIKNHEVAANNLFRKKLLNGPHLKDFFKKGVLDPNWKDDENEVFAPYLDPNILNGRGRKVYFEIYGCQMNVNDTDVIWSILKDYSYGKTDDINDADVIFLVTCAIRESAEDKIWNKLNSLKGLRKSRSKDKPPLKVGVIGCMAERLKEVVLEKDQSVDLVVGPDAYRDIPKLLALTNSGHRSINVLLSVDETYADIMPVRLNENSISAYISIMRGCDNMCSYCIVPWTRGKERSRPVSSILREVENLVDQGVKDITLLGQNVNSYRDISKSNGEVSLIPAPTKLTKGFQTVYKPKVGGLRFSHLIEKVAKIDPEVRIRFTSPHPKDFPDDLLYVIRDHPNICKSLHLPAQSGNSQVLQRMRRGYTREAYLELIDHVRDILPNVALSSDFICGFCGETDSEFSDTLSLIEQVQYNSAYLFMYSMREKTTAHRRFQDDVPNDVKHKRLLEMIELYRQNADKKNRSQIGQTQLVLIEGPSKRSNTNLVGRNDQNIKVIIPGLDLIPPKTETEESRLLKPGDYVAVHINDANSQILKGIPLYRTSLVEFSYLQDNETQFMNRGLTY
ncbi:CDK5RAP1-like protein [Coccinella septempunctata]|uniref:CDK5RAP1-like protein n=1 Tax=Coccinella septempunctata TaxID=41139 RepID=UPI001D07A9C0|nr:CDK5RAP1-like protein [Coccinella septempunctata]